LPEDWQFGFRVKGLIAPEKEIVFDDSILVRGVPPSADAYVFFKATIQKEEEKDRLRDELLDVLRSILQIYGLVTSHYAEPLPGSVAAKISSENPFGYTQHLPPFYLVPLYDDEKRRKNIPLLEKAMAKYASGKTIFQDKNKAFLKNAIDYYCRSLGDFRLEEQLIDLMIALESLFSRDPQELRLRLSLRASYFLSVGQESEFSKIFTDVYSLYEKRSKVVHGTELVDLDSTEISILQEYLREAIKRFTHIETSKQGILELLDESVYDRAKRELLNQIILEAIKKW